MLLELEVREFIIRGTLCSRVRAENGIKNVAKKNKFFLEQISSINQD